MLFWDRLKQWVNRLTKRGDTHSDTLSDEVDIETHRGRFFEKIQTYYETGMLREVRRCDHFCVYAFGEMVYLACPYMMFDDVPYGILMSPGVMKRLIKNNRRIYPLIQSILTDKEAIGILVYMFEDDMIDEWRQWLKDTTGKKCIDPQLEHEIQTL